MVHVPTPEERRELGQSKRKQLRRQDHGKWDPKARRHNPIALLEESMRGRVTALVPLKYERMALSPFGFFRGAVPIMAADLSLLPNTGIVNQICGDAHVRNLGAFAAPDGRLVFDINDFDESIRGPFEWDLKRLATSLVLAGREIHAKESASRAAVLAFMARYRKCIKSFAQMSVLEVAHYQVHRLQRISPVSKVLLKAERATPMHTLESITVPVKATSREPAHRVFKENKPVITRLTRSQTVPILASLKEYSKDLLPERQHFLAQYQAIDVCFKVVGTGSVGTRDYCIYFEGNGPSDPLFLQIKEEPGSAYARYLDPSASRGHCGRLSADGQRAMQFQSDPFLGWTTIAHRDYIVRQLNDHKASIEVTDLAGEGLTQYAEICGELLARGHSRSGDPQVLAGYIGNSASFGEAIADFATTYANQTEADWHALLKSKHVPPINTPQDAKAAAKDKS